MKYDLSTRALHRLRRSSLVQDCALMERLLGRFRQSSPCILIGMHRSGTSLLSRLLQDLGVFMGLDQQATAESKVFQKLNKSLLRSEGSDWARPEHYISTISEPESREIQEQHIREVLFREGEFIRFWTGRKFLREQLFGDLLWGWKDPRTALTLPVWREIFPTSKVIHIVRNGIDSAISLHLRESGKVRGSKDFIPECQEFNHCFRLWEKYVATARKSIQEVPERSRIELRYEDLLREPEIELSRIATFLELPVGANRMREVIPDIDSSRLDNTDRRSKYDDEIAGLPESNLLHQYGYQLSA